MEHTEIPVSRVADAAVRPWHGELELARLECVLNLFLMLSLTMYIYDAIVRRYPKPDATNALEKNAGRRRKQKREIDWNLLESLQKIYWVWGYSSNFTKVDVFVDISILGVSKAVSELSRKFKLTDEQLRVYGVKSYKFQPLNGTASFGPLHPLCFKNADGVPKFCTAGCSIDDRYIITSGHESSTGTDYFYKDVRRKNLIGRCVFHQKTPASDIAIIDTKKRKLKKSFFGRKEVNILTLRNIRKTPKFVVGKVNIYVSSANEPLVGELEATWNKEHGGFGVNNVAAGQARPREGDSGCLVTARRKDGLREENAIGIVSGIGTYTTIEDGPISHIRVVPISPAIEEFRQTRAQTEDA